MSENQSPIFMYLDGEELMKVGFTCSSLLREAENLAREIVKSVNHQYVSGPIKLLDDVDDVDYVEEDPAKIRFCSEGTNNFYLCAPIDEQDFDKDHFDMKRWLPLLRRMERMTQDIYYLGFEVALGDSSAPSRYLRKQDKLSFNSKIFLSSAGSITSYHPPPNSDSPHRDNITIRAGHVQVTQKIARIPPNARDDMLIFSVSKKLTDGVHRIICRFACEMSAHRAALGILGCNDDGTAVWEARSTVHLNIGREIIVGLEYDSSQHLLQTYTIIDTSIYDERISMNQNRRQLYFAVNFSRVSAVTTYNQLSVHECCRDEWARFLTHNPRLLHFPQFELIPEGEMMHIQFSGTRSMQSLNFDDAVGLFGRTTILHREEENAFV
ncbi:hypothetical protein ACHAW6_009665 [Cyclotella cf. meneghiniana]